VPSRNDPLHDSPNGNPLFEGDLGRRLHRSIVKLLEQRHGGDTICPSEAARAVARDLGVEWRDLMRPVRHVAEVLYDQGRVEALQSGTSIDIRQARGPIRLRLKLPRLA
jgi:hypothetical protein